MKSKCSGKKLMAASKGLKADAARLLANSHLLSILGLYGEIRLMGSYPTGLMVNGDIDVYIIRKKRFTKDEVLKIFVSIISETFFTSYFFGDWYKSGKDPNFPRGYYIGLKKVYRGQKWKIDLWFLDEKQQRRNDQERLNICDIKLTPAQTKTILKLKHHRNSLGITMSGQKVYEAVLVDGITTIARFRRWMKR
jgi:hypothetical protein